MPLRKITPEQLAKILELHGEWVRSDHEKGERAYLRGADLREADLSEANLSEADLRGAYLRGADLSGADLSGAYLRGADLREADLSEANLSEADLRGAYLRGADLSGADLSGAYLSGADLSGAYLREADLSEANLSGADLRGADLSGADLSGAYLSGADLSEANLSGADLSRAKEDIFKVLEAAPKEVPGLLQALKNGKINGSAYEGDCACLVGTIANVRGCNYQTLEGLKPDSSRMAERWFLAISQGNTPKNHPIAKITAEWIEEWISKNKALAEKEG